MAFQLFRAAKKLEQATSRSALRDGQVMGNFRGIISGHMKMKFQNEIMGENEIEIPAASFRENENEIPNLKTKLE